MIWWQILVFILLGLLLLMFLRVPVAFSFLMVNIIAAFFIWGQERGLNLLINSIESSLTNFSLLPIPLFILMGEIMFQSKMAPKMIQTVDKWLGNIPGRLSILAVASGSLLSTLTASSMASTAMLGSTLVPEMKEKKYHNTMSMGPILGSGALAALIPPSAIGVLLASLGQISVGHFLVAIVVPGILVAVFYLIYIVVRGKLQPHLAPEYEGECVPLFIKIMDTLKYILPLGLILFFVIGLTFLGIATPTEAAAMGVIGSLILSIGYRTLTINVIVKSLAETMKVSVMILLIVSGSTAFSQILSFSGASRNLVTLVSSLDTSPLLIVIIMLLLVLILGTFLESLSIIMLVVPIFFPIIQILGYDMFWFAVLLLIAIEVGTISPPFGTGLFTLKGVVSEETTMVDIYKASLPFIFLLIGVMVFVMIFPDTVTWLPGLME